MSPSEAELWQRLRSATFIPGTADKRFCQHVPHPNDMSPKQRTRFADMVYRYRRQLFPSLRGNRRDEKAREAANAIIGVEKMRSAPLQLELWKVETEEERLQRRQREAALGWAVEGEDGLIEDFGMLEVLE